MTEEYRVKFFEGISGVFDDLAATTGYEVVHQAANRYGVYEWTCGRSRDPQDRHETYIAFACLPAPDGWHGRLELAVAAHRVPMSARQVVAADFNCEMESAGSWLEQHWSEAVEVANILEPAEAFPVPRRRSE